MALSATYTPQYFANRFRNSVDEDMTFQLFDVKIGEAKISLCNVYFAPGRIKLDALPIPATRGMIYLGNFNVRHPELGDTSPSPNRNLASPCRLHQTSQT